MRLCSSSVAEAIARSGAHPLDAAVVGGGGGGRQHFGSDRSRGEARVHPDDVRFAPGDAEHPRAAAADDDRRVRLPVRSGCAGRTLDAVVHTREGAGSRRPELLHHRDALFHAVDPDARRVLDDAGLLVVGGHPSRAESELDPALGDEVEGGDLLCEHHRVAVVVAEDERADPERRRRLGGDRERDQRAELILEVVGDEKGRVPEPFDPAVRGRAIRAPSQPARAGRRTGTVPPELRCARDAADGAGAREPWPEPRARRPTL